MSEVTRKRFFAALQTKVGLSVGEEKEEKTQLRALFRLPEAQMRQWLVVMHHILSHEPQASWSIDISKKYFLMGGKIVHGWRIILRDEHLDKAMENVANIVSSAPNAHFQVDQVPLHGRGADRNALSNRGKGASPIMGDAGVAPISGMFGR